MTDMLALGFYGAATQRDTFLDYHPAKPDGSANHETNVAGRLKGVATPSDSLMLTGTLEYVRSKGLEVAAFRQL